MVLKSFTKMYAMPGLRFGYAICGNLQLLEAMRTVMQPWNVSIPAEMAAQAAAAETDFAKESARRTAENRWEMKRQMEACGYLVYESNANFLLFCDSRERVHAQLCQPQGTLQDFCLEHGFLIRDCSNFPGLTQGYYRVCVRSKEENESLLAVLRMAAER
jgi:threonine-phosphate decarboxylase